MHADPASWFHDANAEPNCGDEFEIGMQNASFSSIVCNLHDNHPLLGIPFSYGFTVIPHTIGGFRLVAWPALGIPWL